MCTGKCARFVGLSLIPLSLICIVANALLLVPNGKTTWTNAEQLSLHAWLMAGFIGGGLMVRRLAREHRLGTTLQGSKLEGVREGEKDCCLGRDGGSCQNPGALPICPNTSTL